MARKVLLVALLVCLLVTTIPLLSGIKPVGADESYVVRTGAEEIWSTYTSSQKKMAVTSDGHLHVVYYRQDNSGIQQIYHAESPDGGVTWAEQQVTDASRDQNCPSLAVDSHDILHVAWQDGKLSEPGVVPNTYYRQKTTTWQTAELVASYASLPSIAVDSNDDVHLVYMPYKYNPGLWGGGNGIRYRKRTVAGWQAEESISSEIAWVSCPAIAVDGNNNVHVVWNHAPRALYYDLHYRERTSSGWGTEVQINTENDNRGGTVPSIAIDSGNSVHVVWWYPGDSGRWSIRHRVYTTSWQSVEDIEGPTTYDLSYPVVALDRQDHLHVVWSGQYAGSPTFSQMRHREFAGSWQPIENLTSSTSDNQTCPSLIWANYPEIGGVKTSVPENGFAFVWMDGTTIKYYTSGVAISPPAGLSKISPDNNPLPAFRWNTVADAVSYEVRMDSGAWTNIGGRLTFVQPAVLSMGSHAFSVRAVDASANPGVAATLPFSVTVAADLANTKFAFVSDRDDSAGDIYIMNTDGSSQTRLTSNLGADYDPEWSPDGSKIVFQCSKDGNREIYTMNPDGSNQMRITNNTADDGHPIYSPDGTKIAFDSDRDGNMDGNREIYVMNADGSGQTRLTYALGFDDFPCWSPDGTKIVFFSERDGNQEVYVMNADGSGQTRLTDNPGWDTHPHWSPDGAHIAFGSVRNGNFDIYVMNPDGSNQTQLTTDPAGDFDPTWSPDGTRIAFASERGANRDIYVMNADGSNQTRLNTDPGWDFRPSWSTFLSSAPPAGNTPVGSPVSVPLACSMVTFDTVTVAGNTICTSQQGNPGGGIPEGFMLRGQFVDVVTTATYSGPITIGIRYDPSTPNPQNLKLFHWYGGHWDDVTTSVDTTNHIVYGEVNSLSWFFIGGEWVWVDDGGGTRHAPAFPNLYIGIGAVLGAGLLAYAIRRRLATS